jgi:hypothetical protein
MTKQACSLEPTNAQRAEWAKAALAVFTAETYSGDHPETMHPEDFESAIGDLICDLLHLAARKGMDSAAIHQHARGMFEQELAEDEGCDCADRSWYGPYHDTQCPAGIKADATRSQTEGSNSAKPAPDWLDALLNVKRLAGKSGDHEADPFALLDLIADEVRAAIAQATEAGTEAHYTVGSSHGELTIDTNGKVIRRRLDNEDTDGGGHLARIMRFDLAEWRKHWGNPEASRIDILDLGYWYNGAKTADCTYVPPDSRWRSEIAQILMGRRAAAQGKDATTSQPEGSPGYTIGVNNDDGECYDICILHHGDPIATVIAPEAEAAHIVRAANAFETAAGTLRINAVGFAERMADGGIAVLVEALELASDRLEVSNYAGEEDDALEAIRLAINKVKGASKCELSSVDANACVQ